MKLSPEVITAIRGRYLLSGFNDRTRELQRKAEEISERLNGGKK